MGRVDWKEGIRELLVDGRNVLYLDWGGGCICQNSLPCTLKNLHIVLFAKLTLYQTPTVFGAEVSQPFHDWLSPGSDTRRASCDSRSCGHAADFLTSAWGGPSTWPISHPGTLLALCECLFLPELSWGPRKTLILLPLSASSDLKFSLFSSLG